MFYSEREVENKGAVIERQMEAVPGVESFKREALTAGEVKLRGWGEEAGGWMNGKDREGQGP